MTLRLFAAALLAAFSLTAPTLAETYPSHPITVVVPFSAGGPSDAMMRILGERMKLSLGETIVVENITGAGGSIGVARVVHSPADGYTIGFGHLGTHVANGAIYKLDYDLVTDLEPIVLLPSNPMVIVSKNAVPARIAGRADRLAEVAAAAGDRRHGRSPAPAATSRASRSRMPPASSCNMCPIAARRRRSPISSPVRSTSSSTRPRTPSTRSVQAPSAPMPSPIPSASNRRADIPTVDEAGLPNFHMTLWSGLWAPKGTPKEIIAKVNAAALEALADPQMRKKLENLGLQMPPADQSTPEALGEWQKAEIAKWWPMIKAAHVAVD